MFRTSGYLSNQTDGHVMTTETPIHVCAEEADDEYGPCNIECHTRQYMCAQKRPTTNMVRVTLSVTLATHYKHGRGRVIDGGDFRVKPLRCIHNGPYITMGQTTQNESGTVKEDLKRIKIRQKSMQLLKSNLPEIFAGY